MSPYVCPYHTLKFGTKKVALCPIPWSEQAWQLIKADA